MLKANALLLVIVMALVMGLLSGSLILIAYYHRLAVQNNLLMKKLELNAGSGIEMLLAEPDSLYARSEKVWDLYEEESDSLLIRKMPWGLFGVGVVKAFSGRKNAAKAFVYGFAPNTATSAAIYLADNGSPLSVSGNTFIKGTCYLPPAGVNSASMEGFSYTGDNQLVNGSTKTSSYALPPLNKRLIDYLLSFYNNPPAQVDAGIEVISSPPEDSLRRSFDEPTLVYSKSGVVDLHSFFGGNIIIRSDTLVQIRATAALEDVIVFAPCIRVESGFMGKVQLFATDSILLGEHCQLDYPSALGLLKQDFRISQPTIQLGQHTSFKGVLFTHQLVQDLQQTLIKIDEDCTVEGQIYAEGYLELHGTVWGSVTCQKFILKTASSIYENYLLNATVDHSRRSPYFVGSALLPSSTEKRIMKWL